jgi:hypothetical protein
MTLDEKIEDLKKYPGTLDGLFSKPVQFTALENAKLSGEVIFVREDGKVGFPAFNSIPVKIGDTVRGTLTLEQDSCFFVEVHEIL